MEQEHFENDIGKKPSEKINLKPHPKHNAGALTSIDQVRAAERNAEEKISLAHDEADSIINDAKKTAQGIIEQSARAAKDNAANSIDQARQANQLLVDKLTAELNIEIQSLKDTATGKIAEAVELIYESLA